MSVAALSKLAAWYQRQLEREEGGVSCSMAEAERPPGDRSVASSAGNGQPDGSVGKTLAAPTGEQPKMSGRRRGSRDRSANARLNQQEADP